MARHGSTAICMYSEEFGRKHDVGRVSSHSEQGTGGMDDKGCEKELSSVID